MDASQRLQKQIIEGIGITQHSMVDSGDNDSINYAEVKQEQREKREEKSFEEDMMLVQTSSANLGVRRGPPYASLIQVGSEINQGISSG